MRAGVLREFRQSRSVTQSVIFSPMAATVRKRERKRNEEVQAILERAGMAHADASAYLSDKLGRTIKPYHIGRTISGERQPAVDEMDALRELGRRFEGSPPQMRSTSAPLLTDAGDRIPLYGPDLAGNQSLRLTEEFRIGVVPIHPAQRGSKSALAFVMQDETLGDRLRLGDIGYAIRGWPPVEGQPCLIERRDLDALVKIYEGQDSATVFLSQIRPAKKISVPRREIFAVHAVVGATFGPG